MKKFIMGLLVGAAITATGSAYADDIVETLVGKTIEGQFPVKISGKQLETQAAVVDGTSYLPVRAIGEALNMDVKFDADLGIELNQKVGESVVVDTNDEQRLRSENITALNEKVNNLMKQSEEIARVIAPYEQDWIQPDGTNKKKEKDATYQDAVKKKEEVTKALEEATMQLQSAIKENNDIVEGKK